MIEPNHYNSFERTANQSTGRVAGVGVRGGLLFPRRFTITALVYLLRRGMLFVFATCYPLPLFPRIVCHWIGLEYTTR